MHAFCSALLYFTSKSFQSKYRAVNNYSFIELLIETLSDYPVYIDMFVKQTGIKNDREKGTNR